MLHKDADLSPVSHHPRKSLCDGTSITLVQGVRRQEGPGVPGLTSKLWVKTLSQKVTWNSMKKSTNTQLPHA